MIPRPQGLSSGALRSAAGGLLHLLFPACCHTCARPLPPGGPPFCDACRAALCHDPLPACPRCAATVGPFSAAAGGCPACRGHALGFEAAFRLGPYDGVLREAVLRIKHAAGEGLAELLGELWAEAAGPRLRAPGADALVPVPLHWLRRLRRGYNQSAALARGLAGRLGVPVRPGWLRRVRHTPRQTGRSFAERRDNVRGAFRACGGSHLRGKSVLLVDDVLTTGATAGEAARALLAGGASRVAVAALARAGE